MPCHADTPAFAAISAAAIISPYYGYFSDTLACITLLADIISPLLR